MKYGCTRTPDAWHSLDGLFRTFGVAEDLPYIPLYRRTLTWAMAKKVSAVQWPNDTIELRWVRIR